VLSASEPNTHRIPSENHAVGRWFVESVGWLLSTVLLPALFAVGPPVGEGPDAQHVGCVLAAFLARTPANTEIEGVVRIGHGRYSGVSLLSVESLSVVSGLPALKSAPRSAQSAGRRSRGIDRGASVIVVESAHERDEFPHRFSPKWRFCSAISEVARSRRATGCRTESLRSSFEFWSGCVHHSIETNECLADGVFRVELVSLARRVFDRFDNPYVHEKVEIPTD
jgi:hypothetical protein